METFAFFLFKTRNSATPIKKYNIVQTGPNKNAGGFKKGLFKVAYQVVIELNVKIEPMIPAASQTTTHKINLTTLFTKNSLQKSSMTYQGDYLVCISGVYLLFGFFFFVFLLRVASIAAFIASLFLVLGECVLPLFPTPVGLFAMR